MVTLPACPRLPLRGRGCSTREAGPTRPRRLYRRTAKPESGEAIRFGAAPTSLIWPALVAVCPPMMFFMMRGMRGSSTGRSSGDHDPSTPGVPPRGIGTRRTQPPIAHQW
ncbi:DUF2933 domain-containing protein [Streptomyces sp. NPDC058864]